MQRSLKRSTHSVNVQIMYWFNLLDLCTFYIYIPIKIYLNIYVVFRLIQMHSLVYFQSKTLNYEIYLNPAIYVLCMPKKSYPILSQLDPEPCSHCKCYSDLFYSDFFNPNPTRIFLFGILINRSYCMSKKSCPFLYIDSLYKNNKINQIIVKM